MKFNDKMALCKDHGADIWLIFAIAGVLGLIGLGIKLAYMKPVYDDVIQ